MRFAPVVLAIALAVPVTALASKAEFNKLVKQAERLYEAGKYKDSAEALIEAYAYDPNPRLIYNIARAYDQAGELELSLEYYQRYMASREGTDSTLLKRSALAIDRVRGLIAQRDEVQKKQAEEQARVEAEAKAARERAASEAAAKEKAEKELRQREKASAEARASSTRISRIAAFALGGVAIAGLGTGTVFGLQANGSKGRFTAAESVEAKQQLEGQTRTQAMIADAGFGVGVVAAIVAVILYPKGGDDAASTSAVLVPHAGGAGVEVRF